MKVGDVEGRDVVGLKVGIWLGTFVVFREGDKLGEEEGRYVGVSVGGFVGENEGVEVEGVGP